MSKSTDFSILGGAILNGYAVESLICSMVFNSLGVAFLILRSVLFSAGVLAKPTIEAMSSKFLPSLMSFSICCILSLKMN